MPQSQSQSQTQSQDATPSSPSATPSTPSASSPDVVETFRALPKDRQRALLGKMSDDQKQKLTAAIDNKLPQQPTTTKDKVLSILHGRKTEDLSYRERLQIISLVAGDYAQDQHFQAEQSKSWTDALWHRIKSIAGEATGVSAGVLGGAIEPKNLAIGASGVVDPAIPGTYFFLEGLNRLPGEARKAQQSPTPENIQSALMTGAQVSGSVAGTFEGAGTGAAGNIVKRFLEGESKAEGSPKSSAFQRTMQRRAGTGPALAEEVGTKMQEETAKHNASEQEQFAKAKASYDVKVADINKQYEADVKDAQEKFADQVGTRERKIAEIEAAHAERVAKERADYAAKLKEYRGAKQAAAQAEAQHEELEGVTRSLTRTVDENVKNTEKLVHNDLTQQFNAVRDRLVVEPATDEHPAVYPELNADYLEHRVDEAREMLHGAPEDIKVFNDLMKQMAKGDPNDPNTEFSLNWDEGRTQSSALGRASASESVSGSVQRAIRHVLGGVDGKGAYSGLDGELQRVADEGGMGKAYARARQGWKQYMEDWHDMSGEGTGGSTLARLYRAADQPIVQGHVLDKNFGDRLLKTFAKYKKFGASPEAMLKLKDYAERLKAWKGVKVPEPPIRPETKMSREEMAKLPPPVEKEHVERKPLSTPPPPADIHAAPTPAQMIDKLREEKQARLHQYQEQTKTPNRHDVTMAAVAIASFLKGIPGWERGAMLGYSTLYLISRFGEIAMANSEIGVRYLSQITDHDIETLNKLYEKDAAGKATAQQTFTDTLIERAKNKTGLRPNMTAFFKFLTPEQMKRVLQAYMPIGQPQPPIPKMVLGVKPPPQSSMGVNVQR